MKDDEPALSFRELREVIGAWAKATFDSRAESICYHYELHGVGQGVLWYTREARHFLRMNRRRAQPHPLETGEMGLKISAQGRFGIYTHDGKIVSYE